MGVKFFFYIISILNIVIIEFLSNKANNDFLSNKTTFDFFIKALMDFLTNKLTNDSNKTPFLQNEYEMHWPKVAVLLSFIDERYN